MKKQLPLLSVDPLVLKNKRVDLLVARWHTDITSKLEAAATNCLRAKGLSCIFVHRVPGCFELPLAARCLAERPEVDALVALGCVIQGETPHFTYVCRACCDGLLQVSLQCRKPLGLGVITAKTLQQAQARSSTEYNKGEEAAVAAVDMLMLMHELKH